MLKTAVPLLLLLLSAAPRLYAGDETAAAAQDVKVIQPEDQDEGAAKPDTQAAQSAAPAPAPAPAAAAAPAAPVYETVTAASAPSSQDASEWDYLKGIGASSDDKVLEIALPQVSDWLTVYPNSDYAPEAQLLKAQLHLKLGDWRGALTDLLKHFQAYPKASCSAAARKLFAETLRKKAGKSLRPVMEELAKAPDAGGADMNVSLLLEKLAVRAGEDFYKPLCAEFREFLTRFPDYAKNDEVRMALADLHLKNGEPLAARLEYEKLIRLCPASALQSRAKLALAGVLADELKEYDRAIEVYQDVTASYPGTPEAWKAYGRLPQLCERRRKYAEAVDVHERVIALYPDKEEAYAAFTAEARLLRSELDRPADAVAVLGRLADKYKGKRAIDAMWLAAEICRKDMKDAKCELKVYDRIAADYQSDPEAPKALYAAGTALEKIGDDSGAEAYYSKIADKYAESSFAAKAKKRISSMEQEKSAGGIR